MLYADLYGLVTALTEKYPKESFELPIPGQDIKYLLEVIPENDYTYLTINDGVYTEIIKVTNSCEALSVERGQGGTAPHTFPKGSCVKFEVSPPVVKDLICQTECCEESCEPVAAVGTTAPIGKVGVAYEAYVIFTGSTPMAISAGNVPSWMSVAAGPNYARLFGVPTFAGVTFVSVAATNSSKPAAIDTVRVEVTT